MILLFIIILNPKDRCDITFFTQNARRFLNYLVCNIFTNYFLRTRSNSSLFSAPYVQSSFSPARRDSFRTQHHFYSIPKPPTSSSRLSLISFTHLLRLRSPGLPLLSSSVWFPPTVLGEMLCNALTSWRDVTVSAILLLLSRFLQHIKLLSPDKMTSFAVKLKGTPLLKGFQYNGLCFKVSLVPLHLHSSVAFA